jgi:N-acetylneuraminate synthase
VTGVARVYVIAEAGVNHNGSIETALALVEQAAAAGADAVKFQTFSAKRLVTAQAPKAAYQLDTTPSAESQRDMIARLELTPEDHRTLIGETERRGIEFLSSPFDLESIDLLASLGLRTFKLPSGALTDLPYLRRVAHVADRIILSTGMATLAEVSHALEALRAAGADDTPITLLHCTTEYPTPPEDVNLRAMTTLAEEFGLPVGYSDHTAGIAVPIAAAALGATVIEKHFTLDRAMEGPDHRASLEPADLARMVSAVREVEQALGSPVKAPTGGEAENARVVRKSIAAAQAIRAGDIFTEDNLTTKRPGTGISPMRWDEILGRPAPRDFREDELIEL